MTEKNSPSNKQDVSSRPEKQRKNRLLPPVVLAWFWITLAVLAWAGLIALAMSIEPTKTPFAKHLPHTHEGIKHRHEITETAKTNNLTPAAMANKAAQDEAVKQPAPIEDPRMSMLVGDPAFGLLMNADEYALSSNLNALLLLMANNEIDAKQTQQTSAVIASQPDDERVFGNLQADERMVLSDFATIWGHLNADKRKMLRQRARTYAATSDDILQASLNRLDDWLALESEARHRIQKNHAAIQALPAKQQQLLVQASKQLSLLSEQEKNALTDALTKDSTAAQTRIKAQWEALTTEAKQSSNMEAHSTPNRETQVELPPLNQ